jgi:hypothetical protein
MPVEAATMTLLMKDVRVRCDHICTVPAIENPPLNLERMERDGTSW